MKFVHLSDLHIGKRVNDYSMLEDQAYIFKKIINIIDEQSPDCVIIAGDVYDKPVPSAEAVELFDDFLVRLSQRNLKVFIISGNHDSPERIAFGGRLMSYSGIYVSPVYGGSINPVELEDEYGKISVWMLPFIKPAHVKRFHDDADISSYTDAVKYVIDNLPLDKTKRNVMITHQFVTGARTCESEELSVGGTDNIDASVFDMFDYTALGHIHRPQNCKSEKIRYSGTPLKYSFSEADDVKSVTIVELNEGLSVNSIPLVPMRDMVEIKGKYNDIMHRDFYRDKSYENDYVHITLTDEEDIPDAIGKLRTVYKNIMKLDYDNTRTRFSNVIDNADDIHSKSHFDQFKDFYEMQNNHPMTEEQSKFIKSLIEDIWEGER